MFFLNRAHQNKTHFSVFIPCSHRLKIVKPKGCIGAMNGSYKWFRLGNSSQQSVFVLVSSTGPSLRREEPGDEATVSVGFEIFSLGRYFFTPLIIAWLPWEGLVLGE